MSFLGLTGDDSPALVDASSGQTTSFRRLLHDAGLLARRLGRDQRLVFLLSRNDAFSTLVYAATQLHGHTAALLDGSKSLDVHARVLAAYRPHFVAGPSGTAEELQARGLAVDEAERSLDGELIRLADPLETVLHPSLALLLGTSGTTGSSKYVRLSAANVEANARAIADYLRLTPNERPITSLPLHYSFGLSVLNSHWLAGAAVVLTGDSVLQRAFWDSVESHACTSLAGVPYTYQMLERIGYRDMDLPSVTTMQQAGGSLDRSLALTYGEHMRRKGGRFFVMYGQTEATARIAYVPAERLAEKAGSAGVAIPGGRLHVETSDAVASGQPHMGEIVYEGPNVMLGYAESLRDLATGDELGGVLHTGDIGYLDAEGYLYLTGRSKRIAKVFGLRVNLDEVESMLHVHGPAAVIAGDDTIRAFCAFGTDDTMADLRRRLSQQLQLHPSALELHHVDELPVTSAGKIDYAKVEQLSRDEKTTIAERSAVSIEREERQG